MQADVVASVEHALADRPGDWRVVILGSQANDQSRDQMGSARIR